MLASDLYNDLDKQFNIADLTDDWSFMDFNSYIYPGFKSKYMGLVVDNAKQIEKVYTATFPDSEVIQKLLDIDVHDSLLFSHHAMGYNGALEGFPFYNIPIEILEEMKKRRISFYVLHAPLDKNGEYSTGVSLAKALKLQVEKEFCQYGGFKVGLLCSTEIDNAVDFADYVKDIVGHEVKLREYGNMKIKDRLVGVAGGGGSYPFVAEELAALGVNLYLTGFTRPLPSFEPTMEFHRIAENNGINVIGATHYSTEKYACIAMTDYFKRLGLDAEFIEGKYYLEDL